jgi:hypothetical protein
MLSTLSLLIGSTNPSIRSGQSIRTEFGILAEIGSFQLEYAYLAKLTGNKTQFHRVESFLLRQVLISQVTYRADQSQVNNAMQKLVQADTHFTGGLLPIGWNLSSGQPHDSMYNPPTLLGETTSICSSQRGYLSEQKPIVHTSTSSSITSSQPRLTKVVLNYVGSVPACVVRGTNLSFT